MSGHNTLLEEIERKDTIIEKLQEQLEQAERIIMAVSNSTRPGVWDITKAYQNKYMKNRGG